MKKKDKEYVEKYAIKHELTFDEALNHAIVKSYLQREEEAEDGRNKMDKD